MKRLGILGRNISYSISPFLHSRLAELKGLELEYGIYDGEALGILESSFLQLDGFNVTIPFKQDILSFCDERDAEVEECGAANTVSAVQGRRTAFNTDVIGLQKALAAQIPDLLNFRTVLLGAGGAARAALAALRRLKVQETEIWSRRSEATEQIIREQSAYGDIRPYREGLKLPTLWLNTAPIVPEGLENRLHPGDIFYNLSYRLPDEGPAGVPVFNGLEMLLQQGLAAAEIWFGPLSLSPGEEEELRQALQRKREELLPGPKNLNTGET